MMQTRPIVLAAAWALLTSSLVAADHSFPLRVIKTGPDRLTMEPVASAMKALERTNRATLRNVPLAENLSVDLELTRVHVVSDDGVLVIDGVTHWLDRIDEGLTMWTGSVAGEPESTVYLAFSMFGSRGLIHTQDQRYSLAAQPRDGSDWSDTISVMAEASKNSGPPVDADFCASDKIQQFPSIDQVDLVSERSPDAELGACVSPIYEAEIALETDYQFYQLFNNQNATIAYAVTLFGAVSDRYREQVGVIHTMPYLGIYTSNNDPWTEQDMGGSCIDVLYQFKNAWDNGAGPGNPDLYTMYSGANLGCGVAWLDVLCDDDYGFSVCGNMGGDAQFPIQQGNSGNWDFMVAAHELGHNFASPHTHDFCPPVDRCAPSGYFGQCQNSQNCTSSGTIMSYCHLCSGGLNNITTYFHPTPIAVMRTAIQNSCMNLFKGITSTTDLGYELSGSNGDPELTVAYNKNTNVISFTATSTPTLKAGLLLVADNQLLIPFKGGTLVPDLDTVIGLFTSAGGVGTVSGPVGGAVSFPCGQDLSAQMWFQDPGGPNGVAASNGVEFEFIAP